MSDPLIVDVYAGDVAGKPDWSKLVAAGPPWHGAIIKATEGLHYAPPWFGWNWDAIRSASGSRFGVDFFRGCYHYLRFDLGGIEQARAFISRQFEALLVDVRRDGVFGHDYKSALQEDLQSRGEPLPEYRLKGASGPDHRKVFLVEIVLRGEAIASASGPTKKEAEQEAARLALEQRHPDRALELDDRPRDRGGHLEQMLSRPRDAFCVCNRDEYAEVLQLLLDVGRRG